MEGFPEVERYLISLRRRWWLIVGLAVLGAVVGFVWTAFLPKTYEATTTILVTTPKLRPQFDSRLLSTTELGLSRELHRTFMALARTQALEEVVLKEMGDRVPPRLRQPGMLREKIHISQMQGSSALYRITAQSDDPAFAQELANVWASKYVEYINSLYDLSPGNKADIERSLEMAQQRLEDAEKALQEFRSTTGMGLVDNVQYLEPLSRRTGLTQRENLFGLYERYGALGQALQIKNNTLGLYLAARDAVAMVLDAAGERPDSAPAEELPLELLSLSDVLARGPLDLEALRRGTVGEARAMLQQEQGRLDEVIRRLQADLATLTEHLSAQDQKLAALVREQALAEESYIILSLKEAETQTKDVLQSDSWMLIVDPASPPIAPISPRPLFNTVLGGFVGVLVGFLGALWLAWRERYPIG